MSCSSVAVVVAANSIGESVIAAADTIAVDRVVITNLPSQSTKESIGS